MGKQNQLISLLFTLSILCFTVTANAVPARFKPMRVLMSDGTYETIRLCGDGQQRFYLSSDGYIVEEDESGDFFIKTSQTPADVESSVIKRSSSIGSAETAPISSIGSPKIPVILVNFSDEQFTIANTDEEIANYYDKYCNGTLDGNLYTDAGSAGAVRDYFAQESDSLFLPEFVVVGPVTLSKPMAYYGANSGSTIDVNFTEFCVEALQAALNLYSDFDTDFDNDENGTVDLAFFIYAGLPESDTGVSEDAIWPKEMVSPMTISNVTISVMGCCSELSVSDVAENPNGTYTVTETMNAGIGSMCHELSHSLGLPDMYDTNYVGLGMSYWSLMDSGNYCNNGYRPCGYTGYEREFLGWRNTIELTEPTTVTLHPLEDGGTAYKIVNDANSDEYYVLENRYTTGWDLSLARLGHGMLVVHVDYDSARWANNSVNTESTHQRMSFIPANNSYIGTYNATTSAELVSALGGQPYPGTSENDALTDETTPASTVFTGSYMSKPITQIRELDNGDISFKFMALGQLDAPENLTADSLQSDSFTLSWDASDNASAYTVAIYSVTNDEVSEEPVLTIDSVFTNFCSISVSSDYTEYACTVTALDNAYEDSPASDYAYVTLPADAIISIQSDANITSSAEIYTIGGILVGTSLESLNNLPRGIYIIRSNGETYKKIIK